MAGFLTSRGPFDILDSRKGKEGGTLKKAKKASKLPWEKVFQFMKRTTFGEIIKIMRTQKFIDSTDEIGPAEKDTGQRLDLFEKAIFTFTERVEMDLDILLDSLTDPAGEMDEKETDNLMRCAQVTEIIYYRYRALLFLVMAENHNLAEESFDIRKGFRIVITPIPIVFQEHPVAEKIPSICNSLLGKAAVTRQTLNCHRRGPDCFSCANFFGCVSFAYID